MATRVIRLALILAMSLAAVPVGAADLTTRVIDGRKILVLQGGLITGDDRRFAQALTGGPYAEVWFDSPGGSVSAGQGIGRLMRRHGLMGRVPQGATCASACVDAFLGAPVRFVDTPYTVGVHMFSIYRSEEIRDAITDSVEDGKVEAVIFFLENVAAEAASNWFAYMMEMGVAPSLISWTVEVPHVCIYWLSQQEMLHFNVVNTGGPPRPGFSAGNGKWNPSKERCD